MAGNSVKRPNTIEVALEDVLEWAIQRWVAWSGQRVRTMHAPWLEGPMGERYVGAGFYEAYAEEQGLDAIADDNVGLLPDFDVLSAEGLTLLWSEPRSG